MVAAGPQVTTEVWAVGRPSAATFSLLYLSLKHRAGQRMPASASGAGLHSPPLSLKQGGHDHSFLPISPGEEVAIPSKMSAEGSPYISQDQSSYSSSPIQRPLVFKFSFSFLFHCLFSASSPSPPGAPGKEGGDDVIEGTSPGHQAFPAPVTDTGMAGSAL